MSSLFLLGPAQTAKKNYNYVCLFSGARKEGKAAQFDVLKKTVTTRGAQEA